MRGRIRLILLTISLGGCNQNMPLIPSWAKNGTESEEGIIVYDSQNAQHNLKTIDQWWIETKQCLQMETMPPTIVFVDKLTDVCLAKLNETDNGATCNNGDLMGWFIAIERDFSVKHLFKHEFIHYISEENGDSNHFKHDSNDPLWQCEWN